MTKTLMDDINYQRWWAGLHPLSEEELKEIKKKPHDKLGNIINDKN